MCVWCVACYTPHDDTTAKELHEMCSVLECVCSSHATTDFCKII